MVGGVIWLVLSEIQSLETTEYTNHSYEERTAFEPELSNFLPLLFSDRAQNLGNIIIWWEESFGEFWVKSNSLELRNTPTTPTRNNLPLNLNCPISYTY
ncbi:hypothetical protein ACE6H2_016372 [Prunus campanulata]